MGHDIFISYSSKDKPVGDAVCATLEAAGIRCWIAPRDIRPGAEWSEAIIDAIAASRAMVLVFSANANASPQVVREVERAVAREVLIVPFRIEDVPPSKSLEYFISTPHWMDAYSGPLEEHLRKLVETLRPVIFGGGELASTPGPDDALRRARSQLWRPGTPRGRWRLAGKAAGVLVLAGVGAAIWCRLLGVGQPRPAAAVAYVPGGPLSGSIPVNPLPTPPPRPPPPGPLGPAEAKDRPPGRPPLPPPPGHGGPPAAAVEPSPDGPRLRPPPAPAPAAQGPLAQGPLSPERRQERQQERADALRAVQGLRVQSIVAGGARKSCLIDGRVYAVGDTVNGLKIDAIRDRSLVVAKGPFRFEVTLGDEGR